MAANRVETSCESFAKQKNVWFDVLVVNTQTSDMQNTHANCPA